MSKRNDEACLRNDPEYRSAPKSVDDSEMETRVSAFRNGDNGQRDWLINAHLRLVATIGRRWKSRNHTDCEGEALLALVDAVDRAACALEDNNITKYIKAVVRDRLREFVASDRAVYMPARTFRDKAAKGEIDPESNSNATIIGVVSHEVLVRQDAVNVEDDEYVEPIGSRRYTVPIAKTETPSPEFKECLALAIHDETERRVIDLRCEGYGYQDMESVLGLKKSRIGDHVNAVKERFFKLYA